jgi:hypothetical protein
VNVPCPAPAKPTQYLQGIDPEEIIATVRTGRAPMMSAKRRAATLSDRITGGSASALQLRRTEAGVCTPISDARASSKQPSPVPAARRSSALGPASREILPPALGTSYGLRGTGKSDALYALFVWSPVTLTADTRSERKPGNPTSGGTAWVIPAVVSWA